MQADWNQPILSPSTRLHWIYKPRHRYRLLGVSLLALHAAVALSPTSALKAAFLFVHFGLFLLWQPLWSNTDAITPRAGIALLVTATVVSVVPSWGPLALWMLVLLGNCRSVYALVLAKPNPTQHRVDRHGKEVT